MQLELMGNSHKISLQEDFMRFLIEFSSQGPRHDAESLDVTLPELGSSIALILMSRFNLLPCFDWVWLAPQFY